jgi:hypothetical protein
MLGKLNCYVTRVSIFLILAALIAGIAGCVYIPPSGNLKIRTWYDLDAVRNNLTSNYTLMNDLDSTTPVYTELASPTANGGKGWQPIGTDTDPFTGALDGQGYEILNLYINRPRENDVGLFGGVGQDGVVQNIGVVNATVTGYLGVGALAGENLGTVSNSYSTGSVTGDGFVGGLLGGNLYRGTVSNSYSTGSVTGTSNTGCVGGLVGYNEGNVSNSYATSNVTGNLGVGGLVGGNLGTISNSYATGNVTGDGFVGGLLGGNDDRGTVSNSYSTGSVTGNSSVGGLLGFTDGSGIVSNSYYNYAEVLINGQNIITIGALFGEDFDQWLANGKFLNVNDKLSQEDDYYMVNNISDFEELLAFGQNATLKFRLKNDLNLDTEPNFYIPYFAGEFDGNGHKISNLSFNFDFVSDVGLFGHFAPGGKVTQVGVENVNITGGENVGGLVGYSWNGTVSNSYSTGSVTGDKYVGGLVGGNTYGAAVSNSYSTGSVTGDKYVGGLVGRNSNNATVSNSFWDTQTSGQSTSAGGTGKNTTEMQDIATFSGAAWNIIAVALNETNPAYIWNIVNNVTYPFLSWQP